MSRLVDNGARLRYSIAVQARTLINGGIDDVKPKLLGAGLIALSLFSRAQRHCISNPIDGQNSLGAAIPSRPAQEVSSPQGITLEMIPMLYDSNTDWTQAHDLAAEMPTSSPSSSSGRGRGAAVQRAAAR